jgi:hypothetical protein
MRKRSPTQKNRSTLTSTRNELLAEHTHPNALVKRSETVPKSTSTCGKVSPPVAGCQGRQIGIAVSTEKFIRI